MAIFDTPIYIKQPDEDDGVIVFGKSPLLKKEDTVNGIARFGGPWRAPSYLQAYHRSSEILVNEGMRTQTLDDLGLPIFYIQRHTAELLLKRLLSWVYEIAEFKRDRGIETFGIPNADQKSRFKKSHNLHKLLDDLEVTTKAFSFEKLPDELTTVIGKLTEIEVAETWSRYETSPSKIKGEPDLKHTENEYSIPIVELQKSLSEAIMSCVFNVSDQSGYERQLYDTWYVFALEAGKLG